MTKKKPQSILTIAAVIILTVFSSCNDSGTNSNEDVDVSYGLTIVSGAGDVQTTFIQGLTTLDVTSVDNSNSTELSNYASIFTDGTSLYAPGFGAPATMGKYNFNSSGEAELDQQIIIPGSNSFSTVEIISPTEGYATVGGGLSKVVKFDPSTIRVTGEIDISEAGDGLFYSDLIARDNKLFVALNDFGSSGIAKVAVIDLTTGTLEKVITDSRTSTVFGATNTAVFALNNNGDIYVHGSGLFSEFSEEGKKPSGILRINNGETEFDDSYFFDLTAETGFASTYGLYHFGDDLTFTAVSVDDANFFGSDGANPVFRYYRLNLNDKISIGDLDANIPNSFGASRTMFMVKTSESEILFPIAGVNEDALYSFDINTESTSKKITSTDGFVSGLVILDED